MNNQHWTDKPQETITDTCVCGATLKVTAQYPEAPHKTWLDAHKICRETKPKDLK